MDCSETTSSEDFGNGLLVREDNGSYFANQPEKFKDDVSKTSMLCIYLGKLAGSYITSLTPIFNANPYIYIFLYRSRSFWGRLQNTKDQLQYLSSYSGSPRLSDKRPSRSPGPFSPLDSRRIANVVIAKNLNETHQQVQVQALEVFQSFDPSFTS